MHQEKVKNKITNYWLRAITFGLSNKKQNVTVGRKCSVSCHFCEEQPSQAKDAGARVGERRPWKAETASP